MEGQSWDIPAAPAIWPILIKRLHRVIDPLTQQDQCSVADIGLLCATLNSLFEQRPDERNQWTGNLRYVQHINATDAPCILASRIFSDDWGITSHTFEADWRSLWVVGWTVTPRIPLLFAGCRRFLYSVSCYSQGETSNIVDPLGAGPIGIKINKNGPLYYDDFDRDNPCPC